MKMTCFLLLLITGVSGAYAQDTQATERQRKNITRLIDEYAQARKSKDTLLLKKNTYCRH